MVGQGLSRLEKHNAPASNTGKTVKIEQPKSTHESGSSQTGQPDKGQGKIPSYALEVLDYVKKNGEAPPGFVGGRTFTNREKRLPRNVEYQEWDVHKKVNGKNRGAERLVTGSDNSAYFTDDHYKTFQKIE